MTTDNTAAGLQNTAIANAGTYMSQMQTFISDLTAYLRVSEGSALQPNGDSVLVVSDTLDVTDVQSDLTKLLASAQANLPSPLNAPGMPTITMPAPASAVASLSFPAFPTISVPNLPTLTAPVVGTDPFTGVMPTIDYPVAAVRPDVTLPDAPVFANIVMPTITDIVLPNFTAVEPFDDLQAPTNLFSYSETAYDSALMNTATAKLLGDLVNGSYGIEIADEQALWSRAQERELRGADTAMAEAARQMAARGFSLPAGAMLAQLASAQQDAMEKISTVSREIALKRADMYVEGRKFTFAQVKEYEQLTTALFMSAAERALNSAKATAEFGIALYNSRIAKFNALMEGFRASVMAYEAEVRGALGQLEAQKIKLMVVDAEVGIQKNQAQLYLTQVEGANSLVNMYRTDVSAMQGLADVERLKLGVFQSSVEAYSEQLRAGSLQLQGYEAATRGNMVQAEVYKTEVSAQMIQAEIVKTQSSVLVANAQVSIENLREQIAVATATADVYRSQSQGVAAANESQVRAYQARTESFRSMANIYETMGRLDISRYDSSTRVALENVRNLLEADKITWNVRLGSTTTAIQALGQAVQSNLNQVIGIASAVTSSSA